MSSSSILGPEEKVIICGGGIIGCSVAYFLAERGFKCTVVERCSIACSASGKAGGFLAKDWSDTSELGTLSKLSFQLHETLAEKFKNTDYRKLETLSVTIKEGAKSRHGSTLPGWIDGSAEGHYTMGDRTTTAQVHPFKLTHAYMQAATDQVGSDVIIGKVEGLTFNDNKSKVTGVRVDGKVLDASVVVIAMGPWSRQAADWLNVPQVEAKRAHSLLFRPDRPVTDHAIFVEHHLKDGWFKEQEVYPRPDGDIYTCGMSDSLPLPDDPDKVEPSQESCKQLRELSSRVSSQIAKADMYVTQACYLPLSPDGLPIIGQVPDVKGAFIATGHSCWGILNSPGTGAAMAELITTGRSNIINLAPFDPARFQK